MLASYLQLMRLNRPIGNFLLLWPTWIALWFAAKGTPSFKYLLIFSLGVFVMRAAGCVINDVADRNLDGHVQRTKNRPLAQGKISTTQALILFFGLLAIALLLVLQLNQLTIFYSIAAVCLAISYPFVKRISYYPQIVLGAAFGWSIPMVFAAVSNQVPAWSWILFTATLSWTVAYDTQYAMVDREDDLKIGIRSTAIVFGNWDKALIFSLQLFTLGLMTSLGLLLKLTTIYYVGIGLAVLLAIYQQWLIREREPQKCFAAFLNNNYFGMVLFFGTVLGFST